MAEAVIVTIGCGVGASTSVCAPAFGAAPASARVMQAVGIHWRIASPSDVRSDRQCRDRTLALTSRATCEFCSGYPERDGSARIASRFDHEKQRAAAARQ